MMLVKDTDPKFKSYDVIIQNVIQYNLKESVSWLHRWSGFTQKKSAFFVYIFFILYFFIYIVSQFLFLVLIITPQLIVQFFSFFICLCVSTDSSTNSKYNDVLYYLIA